MAGFKIEKGIPVPGVRGVGRPLLYPFDKLRVGDSFEVPAAKAKSVMGSASSYGASHGMRFVTRETRGGRRRVWRVA